MDSMNWYFSIVYILVAISASLYTLIYLLRMVWISLAYIVSGYDNPYLEGMEEYATQALSNMDMRLYWSTMVLAVVLQMNGYVRLY